MRLLLIRSEPVPRLLAVATCQPAGALAAMTTAGMQTTKVSRASAVNRLALLLSSKPLAIVRHSDDASSGGCRALRRARAGSCQRHRERRALAGVVRGIVHRDRVREVEVQAAVHGSALGGDIPARATVGLW